MMDLVHRADLDQFDEKISEPWTNTGLIYNKKKKNCGSVTDFLKKADFHPALRQQKKKSAENL